MYENTFIGCGLLNYRALPWKHAGTANLNVYYIRYNRITKKS